MKHRIIRLIQKVKSNKKITKIMTVISNALANINITNEAAAFAYYLLLTLFPLLLAISYVLPLMPIDIQSIITVIQEFLPEEVSPFLMPIIEQYLTTPRGGVVSISVIASLWPASKVFNNLQVLLNGLYGVEQRRNFIIQRIFSLVITFSVIIIFFVLSIVFVYGQNVLQFLSGYWPVFQNVEQIFLTYREPFIALILLIFLLLLYKVLPNVKWPFVYALPGAVIAMIAFMLLGNLFSVYLSTLGSSIGTGIIGTVIIIMVYFFLISLIISLGGIVNVVVYDYVHYDALFQSSNERLTIYCSDYNVIKEVSRIAYGSLEKN